MPTLDLTYQSQRWLLLPPDFPDGPDLSLAEWAKRIAATYTVAAPWNEPQFDELLPRHLEEQFMSINPDRTAALWYCPFGLPAAGYVHIALGKRPLGGDVTYETLAAGLRSEVAFELQPVSTAHLGEGVAFTRLRAGVPGDPAEGTQPLPGYAETVYLFLIGESLLVVTARSVDPTVIGLMGEELWNIVESMTVNG
jgi:hypothetical protein